MSWVILALVTLFGHPYERMLEKNGFTQSSAASDVYFRGDFDSLVETTCLVSGDTMRCKRVRLDCSGGVMQVLSVVEYRDGIQYYRTASDLRNWSASIVERIDFEVNNVVDRVDWTYAYKRGAWWPIQAIRPGSVWEVFCSDAGY